MILRHQKINFLAVMLVSSVLGICLPGSSHAASAALGEWQRKVAATRTLAENDAPRAYREAQQLQAVMPGDASGADKVKIVNLLARIELYLGDIRKSSQHSAEAQNFAKQNNDRVGQIEADLVIAASAINQGRLEDMIEATKDAMDSLVGLEREDLRAEVMFHVAMMYNRFGHFDESVTVAMQSLEIAKNSNNPLALAYAEQGIAVSFEQTGLHIQAGEHFQRMMEAARQAHSTLLEAGALLGLSGIAGQMGNTAESERLCKEAIALFRRAGGPLFVGHARHLLADQYRRIKQPAKALLLIDENVAIYGQHENPIGLWWTLNMRSTLLQDLGRLDEARGDAERANGLAKKIGFTVYFAGSARRLADVTAARGEFKQAYRWSAEAAELNVKLERENSSKRILDLAQRFQQESKQRQIDELNHHNERQHAEQRQMQIGLAAMVILLSVTVYFLLRLRKSREAIRSLNAGLEQRVMERTVELFESRQSLSEAQRIAHVGSWELDHVSNALTWSDESHRIFEIAPPRFGGTYDAFLETLHPEDRGMVHRVFQASLENREPYEIEHRLSFPDGRIKYVHEHCETTYDDDGKPLRSIGTVQDITERKEMENALRESRQLLTEAQRIAQVGSWEYDIASDTHTWSDELFRIYEIDPETEGASYDGCMNATHPDDRDAITRAYLNSVETGKPYESEHRLLMADGRIKHVHERCETICGSDGTLLRAVGMMQDITARKLDEQKLKEALEFTEGIISAIPDLLFEMDSDGRYLNIWTHKPEFLAAQKETLLNNTVNEVLAPESARIVMEALCESAAQGVSFGKVIAINLPQGTSWFELSVSKKTGGTFLVLSRDVTERKRLEGELRTSRNFLDSVIDSLPDPIFVKDRQHRWILLNDANCRFTGMSRETLIGKSDHDIFPKEQADVFWKKDEIVFDSGEINLNEESFTSANGEEYFIQTKKTPFVSADGSQMLVGVIRDITDRKQYEAAREAALAEAQRLANMRSEFIAHMSHELRTPLNGILGYAQMLGRDGKLDVKQQASMDVIRQSGEHLLALIEDILDLARIESGKLELDIGDIPLARFLNVVAGIVGIRAKQKHLEFVCEFAPDLPEGIRGDDKRLRQVLLNLLSNAVKFTDRGRITLSVSRVTPSRLAFAVKDTGIGIESSDLKMIFQSFEQVSDTQHRLGGTGLGLSISRQLVRLMGGDIVFESRPGEGSTFRFELELPDASIGPDVLCMPAADTQHIEPDGENAFAEAQIAPPQEELQALHQLALQGNMRDIAEFAERITGIDPRYRPFAERLKHMANGYQSKAILAFVKEHLI